MAEHILSAKQYYKNILHSKIAKSDFAADLNQFINNNASPEYLDKDLFFANTYPTVGLKKLIKNVSESLSGNTKEKTSLFRLETNSGGGKTHSLIALAHLNKITADINNIRDFIDLSLFPFIPIRIATFDGKIIDSVNGRYINNDIKVFTPWGEIAYALNGKDSYNLVSKNDELLISPDVKTIKTLLSDKPTLILIDDLHLYLTQQIKSNKNVIDQISTFILSLSQAVKTLKRTAIVFVINTDKIYKQICSINLDDTFDMLENLKLVLERESILINPLTETEILKALCHRFFKYIDKKPTSISSEYERSFNMKRWLYF